MTTNALGPWQRITCRFLILAFLAAAADVPALARPGADAPIRVINQDVRIEADVALISYDLDAPEGGTFVVTLELRRENDPAFVMIPANMTGDIGDVQATGTRKLIRWEYLKTFPKGLTGDDYYFKIDVNRPGGFPWLWVALGSAAVAGGVVAIVSGKSSPAGAQPGTQELPVPPARTH
jgi:hypothetical protein